MEGKEGLFLHSFKGNSAIVGTNTNNCEQRSYGKELTTLLTCAEANIKGWRYRPSVNVVTKNFVDR